MMVKQDNTGLVSYNETDESILFIGQKPVYPLEFASNKLLLTVHPSQMYVVNGWSSIKCIPDPNTANIYNGYAFMLPTFDEKLFPFIAVVGKLQIIIVNVATLEHKPLVNGAMRSDKAGLRFAFAKGDES